jgi:hypothetical protein
VSSAILYLAIVVIWAFLLVPRWLRKSHGSSVIEDTAVPDAPEVAVEVEERSTELGGSRFSVLGVVGLVGTRRGGDDEDHWSVADEQPEPDTAPIPRITAPVAEPEPSAAPAAAPGPAAPSAPGRPRLTRGKILQARRRLLTTLVTLTIAALGFTALGLTSVWVCGPPLVMLGVYMLLLREAATADAERARWRAEQAHLARQREKARAKAAEAQRTAEIIDISARLNDQLYDQYADATVRAVGD